MVWLSIGTLVWPRSSCSGLARAHESANASAMSKVLLEFCWTVDVSAGLVPQGQAFGIHGFCDSLTGSGDQSKDQKRPHVHSMLSPKSFCNMRSIVGLRTRLFLALVMSPLLQCGWPPRSNRGWGTHVLPPDTYGRWGGIPLNPIPRKERLSDSPLLEQMQMPSVFASFPRAALVTRCHWTVIPWILCSAFLAAHERVHHTNCRPWLLRDLPTVASSEFGQDATSTTTGRNV